MKKLLSNFKWIFQNSKFILPIVFLTILITSSLASLSVYQALVSKNLIDSALSGNLDLTKKYIFIFIAITLISLFISPLTSFLNNYSSTTLTNKLQKNLFKDVLLSKYSEQNKYHSMDIVTRLNNDIINLSSLMTSTLPNIITLIVTLISSFIVLFSIKPQFAIISIVLFPIFLFISKIYGSKQKKIYKEVQEKEVKCSSFIQESIVNSMILKTFSRENSSINKLNLLQKDRQKTIFKRVKINSITNIFLSLGMNIGYLIVYAIAALCIATGSLTVGSFTALIQLFQRIQGPIYGLSTELPSIISSLGATERIRELHNLNKEIFNKEEISKNDFQKILFKDVSFSYDSKKIILDNINLSIKKGDTLGIIGGSGEGKTTFLKLILSLAEPSSGEISIDENILSPLHRELISYVPQGNTLLSGTIKENLCYNDETLSSSDIEKALTLSCCSNFIDNFPDGINTKIGEKGLGLSEGQSQRLSIARAILRKKPILILDEATSALDSDTEEKLLKNLRTLSYSPTTVLVTHRSSSLKNCNKVLKIKNKEILFLKERSKNFL